MGELLRRIWYRVNRRRVEREMADEMAYHRELMSEQIAPAATGGRSRRPVRCGAGMAGLADAGPAVWRPAAHCARRASR